MEITLSCFNCSNPIPDKLTYYFCSRCLTQVRCKNCGELIEKDALGCSNCGTPVLENKAGSKAINTIEFEQKGNNRKFVANFTDHVGENLVASLGGLFLGSSHKPTSTNPFTQSKANQIAISSVIGNIDTKVEEAVFVDPSNDELNNSLLKIFRVDEDKVSLVSSRVKQSGKRDHAIRITLLLLYAYSLTGKQQVKKGIVVEVLQDAGVYDNNYVSWLSKCDEIKKADNDMLELYLPGRDATIEILKEFNNPSIDKGSVHFSATSAKASKGKSKKTKSDSTGNADTSAAKSGKSNSKMTPVKMIDILIAEKYFSEKRRVPEIIKYCKEIKAHTLDTSTLSTALGRKIKSGGMKREKNVSDNQYEYYQ